MVKAMLSIKNRAIKRMVMYLTLTAFLGLLVSALLGGVAGYSIAFNTSQSLKGYVFLINQNDKRVERNELIAFIAPKNKYFSNYNHFIKYVWGVSGDQVYFENNGTFLINGQVKGVAKSFTQTYEMLEHAESGQIKKGEFFVGTEHKDSFDSRYKLIGNIDEKNIIGRAYLLF